MADERSDTASANANTSNDASGQDGGVLRLERDRDAWAAIRGFVYQVDLTIDRWISLTDTDALELERAEDIDYITSALNGDEADAERLLEQVKRRDANVTLRSDVAREALANFYEHRRLNPTLRVSFRLTTTAAVGRERPSPLPGKMPGISAWRSVQTGAIPPHELDAVRAGLRRLLSAIDPPETFPQETWERYQQWLTAVSNAEFMDFINRFEWAVATPDSSSIVPRIAQALVTTGRAATQSEGERLYEHLFAHVFRLLSSPGVKRLTRSDLSEALRGSDSESRILVERLSSLHEHLATRVDALETRVSSLSVEVAGTIAGLQSLSQQIVSDQLHRAPSESIAIELGQRTPPPLSEPPEAPFAARRSDTVDQLLRETPKGPPRVIALHGAQASGKSQLALQVVRRLGDKGAWVHFLHSPVDRAGERLFMAVTAVTGEPTSDTMQTWEARCAAFANRCRVLCLDDVPPFTLSDDFGSRFVVLVRECVRATATVILTSVHRIAALDRLGRDTPVTNALVPPLSIQEVADVLSAHGAPLTVVASELPGLVSGITGGHPVLVQAVADYVARNNWQVSASTLSGLFGNSYARDINDETIRALLTSVSDAETRSLLYRLTITDPEFDREELGVLGGVAPPIERLNERFANILGPWVEAIGNGRYRLSQLVRSLGPLDVPATTKRACHHALAERIRARRRLSELEFISAFGHFNSAHDYDDAALILLSGLHSLTKIQDLPARVAKLWSSVVVPAEASALLQLQVYALQAVLARRAELDPSSALASVELLQSKEQLPPWAVFAASVTITIGLALIDASVAAPYMSRALIEWTNFSPEQRSSLGIRIKAPSDGIEALPWLVAGGVRSAEDLFAWLAALEDLPIDLRSEVLQSKLGRQLAGAVLSRIAVREWERPQDQRSWHEAARVLAEAGERARRMNALMLEAAALGCELSSRLEAGEAIELVTAIAHDAIDRFMIDADAAFLVAKHVAFGVFDLGRHDLALEWLRTADGLRGTINRFDRTHIQIRLSQVLIADDRQAAVYHAERAVEYARASSHGMEPGEDSQLSAALAPTNEHSLLVVQALGELAIVRWLTGDGKGAAVTLVRAIDSLMRTPRDDEEWRTVFARLGHTSGYLVTLLSTGVAPEKASDGSDYLAPFMGMLIRPSDASTASLYIPERFHILGVQAMMLAELADDEECAVQWAKRSASALKDAGLWIAAKLPLERLVRDAVERGAYREAFDYGMDMLTAFWAVRGQPRENVPIFVPIERPARPHSQASLEERREFDAMLLDHVLLPAVLTVVGAYREEQGKGLDRAMVLKDICAELSMEEDATDVWSAASQLIQTALIQRAGANDLIDVAGAFDSENVRTLKALAYFIASFDPLASLEKALHLQLVVIEYLTNKLKLGTRSNERILIPLIDTFWREQFGKGRFLFRNPRLVESDLQRIMTLEPEPALRELLQAMARGLGVDIPKGAEPWFVSTAQL